MTLVRKLAPPPIAALPRTGPADRAAAEPVTAAAGLDPLAAHDIATIAAGLLQLSDAALLAIAIPSDGWGGRAPVLVWDHRLRQCAARTRDLWQSAICGPAMDAVCIAADALFDMLTAAGLCTPDLTGACIVTDGVGVALSASPPPRSDDGGAWLLDLAGGATAAHGHSPRATPRAAPILDFAAHGPWALLSARRGTDAGDH